MTTETKFLTFWRIINELRADSGLPELKFGPAHDEWLTFKNAVTA